MDHHYFEELDFTTLSHLQVGRIGEYWVKIWLTMAGFEVYYNDVDDRGIDFVLRLDHEKHIDVQVKTVRGTNSYVFVTKKSWNHTLRSNLYLALVVLSNHELPSIYLIPSTVFEQPNELFKDRNYGQEEQKSLPEWGISLSTKTLSLLEPYQVKNFKRAFNP